MFYNSVFKLFSALHTALHGRLSGLTDHNPRSCIICNPDAGNSTDGEMMEEFHDLDQVNLTYCLTVK